MKRNFTTASAILGLSLCLGLQAIPASALAAGADCSTIRLDAPGGSMEHVHARDQHNLGICFAETGAQVADAIRFSRLGDKRYGFQTSAVALASGISARTGTNAFLEGGSACQALNFAQDNGICAQSAVECRPNPPSAYRSGAAELEFLIQRTYGVEGGDGSASGDRNSKCEATDVAPAEENSFLPLALREKLVSNSCDIREMGKNLTHACVPPLAMNPFKDKKVRLSCNPFPSSREERDTATPESYLAEINRNLEKPDPLPIEIHFCAKFLDPGFNDPKDDCGAHAALIIGRRTDRGGKVQYLLRNSWGTECAHYPDKYRDGCEEGLGNIWLDASELKTKIQRVIPPPDESSGLPLDPTRELAWNKARRTCSIGKPSVAPILPSASPSPAGRVRPPRDERYTIDGSSVTIVILEEADGKIVAGRCSGKNCGEYLKNLPLSLSGLSDELKGGTNPGAPLCERRLGGQVLVGLDAHGNQNSFCRLRDGSIITLATLHALALKYGLIPSR